MLVTFKSDAYADITMFGDVAVTLLKLMGHSGTVPGALLAEDVPAALENLKKAIEGGAGAAPTGTSPDPGGNDPEEPVVSLGNRAVPLIELLEASVAANCNVMWDK
jgi:hypothetical protein